MATAVERLARRDFRGPGIARRWVFDGVQIDLHPEGSPPGWYRGL